MASQTAPGERLRHQHPVARPETAIHFTNGVCVVRGEGKHLGLSHDAAYKNRDLTDALKMSSVPTNSQTIKLLSYQLKKKKTPHGGYLHFKTELFLAFGSKTERTLCVCS